MIKPVTVLVPGDRFAWGGTTVIVLAAPEHSTETVPPLTGQPCLRLHGRREDTGAEGTMTFGLSAGVQVEDPPVPGRLDVHLGRLGAALVTWGTRDDSRAQPEVTRAGHAAVEAIDAMLAELHRLRAQLLDEIRVSDDAAMARADALLGKARDGARRPVLDSELWTCLGCGGQMVGRRSASDLCRYCADSADRSLSGPWTSSTGRAEGRCPVTRFPSALAVLVVALIAAVISFGHIESVALTYGQTLLASRLLPVSVDGAIVVASMVLLDAAHRGAPAPALARIMLGLGVARHARRQRCLRRRPWRIGIVVSHAPGGVLHRERRGAASMIRVQPQAAPAGVPEAAPVSAHETVEKNSAGPTRVAGSGTPTRPLSRPRKYAQVPITPAREFAHELEAGKLPTVRTVKSRMRCGQDTAMKIRDELSALMSAPAATIEAN